MTAAREPVTGYYLNVEILGRPQRLYVEEAGQGIPLLCLHTAGSDTRQYRGLMNDAGITRDFRVIAFDMPWHGKSSPPAGWQTEEYRLTSADYARMVLEVYDALALDRPVVMGCSIGGRIALVLAMEHAKRFRAIVGLQSGASIDPYYELTWFHHPQVHGGEASAAYVSGLMAPMSPDADRWETLWHYMQSGPGIFKGDLYFYRGADGDIRERVPFVPAHRRIRLFGIAGRHARGGRAHRGRQVLGDAQARALPDEREPGAFPHLPQAGAG
jgi:pimeloyl-ACP methyl ester carboxylesterase